MRYEEERMDPHRQTGEKLRTMERELTPAQRLWLEVFRQPPGEPPCLDQEKVLAIIDSLPDSRERMAVRFRYGFEGAPLAMEEIGDRLPRADGGVGLSRQSVRAILDRALYHLRHGSRRKMWERARIE